MVLFRGAHSDALRLEQEHTVSLSPKSANLTFEMVK